MVNSGPLAAEIGPVVWGHPSKTQRAHNMVIMDSAMGQIPRSTERISNYYYYYF